MKPTIIKSYSGPGKKGEQDIFLILRPQANNYYCESLLLKIIRSFPEYKQSLWLEYLANIPGEMIQSHKLLERHYEYRLFFARLGAQGISNAMKQKFQKHFSQVADNCNIVGSFEAVEKYKFTEKELFSLSNQHSINKTMLKTDGQSIIYTSDKQNNPIYIINADLPDLLHRNYLGTNSAVFIFRTTLSYQKFNRLILLLLEEIKQILFSEEHNNNNNVLHSFLSQEDIAQLYSPNFYRHKHLFHFSNGPFEQILDARDFLYQEDGNAVKIENLTFVRYLLEQGIDVDELKEIIRNPIVSIKNDSHTVEESLFVYTRNMTYEKSCNLLKSINYQKLTKLQTDL